MFQNLPLAANIGVFLVSSVAVWLAGSRVARAADALETRTGMGEAIIGMLLLGFISALPELAVTLSASLTGSPNLAVNNLLGGMALNIAILAAADAAVRGEALTAAIATTRPLLQASLLIVLLAIVGAATAVGDVPVFGVSAWTCAILAFYVLCLRLVQRTRGVERWLPARDGKSPPRKSSGARNEMPPASRHAARIAAGAAVILVAGYALSQSGDALAEQTGLGENFFAAVFISVATSLPEISIVFSAVKIGRYEMAVADILGANLFGLALLFLVDAAYTGGPVLAEVGVFSTFASLLGIAVTGLLVVGLLERSHRTVMRMGADSLGILGVYAAGLVVLYGLR